MLSGLWLRCHGVLPCWWLASEAHGAAVGDGRVGVALGTTSLVGAAAGLGLGAVVTAAVGASAVGLVAGEGSAAAGAGVAVAVGAGGGEVPDGVAVAAGDGSGEDDGEDSGSCGAGVSEFSSPDSAPVSSAGAVRMPRRERSGDRVGDVGSFRRARRSARRLAAPCSRTVGTEPKRRSRASVQEGRPPG